MKRSNERGENKIPGNRNKMNQGMSKIKQNKEKLQSYQGAKRNPTVRLSKSGTK